MLNQTRKLLQRLARPNNTARIDDVISRGNSLGNLQKHAGWKYITEFIATQKKGSDELLDRDLTSINVITIFSFINSFLKYFLIVGERRAYRKIESFVRISIANAKRYEEVRRKQQEREEKSK